MLLILFEYAELLVEQISHRDVSLVRPNVMSLVRPNIMGLVRPNIMGLVRPNVRKARTNTQALPFSRKTLA